MYDIPIELNLREKAIVAYEQEPIEEGKILFYGHSLFTRWGPKWEHRRMDEDIRMKDGSLAVVNHGFGTSCCEELLYYYDRMVRPWKPRAMVVATYGNDMLYGYSPEDVMNVLSRLLHWARTDFPGIKLYIVEVFPVAKRRDEAKVEKWNSARIKRDKFNKMIRAYAATHEDTKVIEMWNCPELIETPEDVGDRTKVREDIFVKDRTHFTQEGYDIVAKIFREALDDLL